MTRYNFTPGDVARTRISPESAPVAETVLAMGELRCRAAGHRHGPASRWMFEARQAFPATARPLVDLLRPHSPWPDFLDVLTPDLKEGLEEVRATPRATLRTQLNDVWRHRLSPPPTWVRNLADGDRESVDLVVRALRDLHRAVVAPRWDNALVAFHSDVAQRIQVLAAGGPQMLFDTLHPELRWRDDGLTLGCFDGEHDLQGQGVILMPSAFWTGPPVVSLSCGQRPNVLIYAARSNGQLAQQSLVTDQADPAWSDSLAALIGPTRATVLRALGEPRGTADLAALVGISPATASEHAKVLRDAYLIDTRREGRAVRHSLTALGRTMLGRLPTTASRSAGRVAS